LGGCKTVDITGIGVAPGEPAIADRDGVAVVPASPAGEVLATRAGRGTADHRMTGIRGTVYAYGYGSRRRLTVGVVPAVDFTDGVVAFPPPGPTR
jgi:hypothetical protein